MKVIILRSPAVKTLSCVKPFSNWGGCKYDATYRVTSVDPPELVRFIKKQHPDVKREVPRYSDTIRDEKLRGKPITMWNLIPKEKYPPTRTSRYCCKNLKESGGDGRITVTGVRWAESLNRQRNSGVLGVHSTGEDSEALIETGNFIKHKSGGVILTNDNDDSRRLVESCYKRHKTNLNPIIDWSDRDVWDFIRAHKIPYCSLYDEGETRLGCIGCPMANKGREKQFVRWPKYKAAYVLAFDKMIKARQNAGLHKIEKFGDTGQDTFNWWMGYDVLQGQMNWFDEEIEDDE